MNQSTPRRTPAQQRGQWAEDQACSYLQQQGLTLLEKNYRTRLGEIDLIMQDGRVTVFIEVRLRKSAGFGGALESIDRRKQARIIAAAQQYLQKNRAAGSRPARIDVVTLDSHKPDTRLQWIKDAIQAG